MATFSSATFKSLNYNSFRPHYPESFYLTLSKYMGTAKVKTAIDLGCGTGVATYPLLNISEKVIGVDLSPQMVSTANLLIKKRSEELGVSSDRITFKTGAVESFLYEKQDEIRKNSIDLITAAQCIHWFQDYDKFFESSAQLLKSGGTLAYFFYVDPVITNFDGNSENKGEILAKAAKIYNKYVYEDPNWIGSHWEQPGRGILANLCVEVNKHIPSDLYNDVKINTYLPSDGKPITAEDLDLKKTGITLFDFMDYMGTYSALHAFDSKTNKRAEFLEAFLSELERECGFDRNETKIDIIWNTGYTFMKRK